MTSSSEWWGEDIIPRIRWSIEIDHLRTISDPDAVPSNYGHAWRVPAKEASIYMPMPINIIARAIRELYWRVRLARFGTATAAMEKHALSIRAKGWAEGNEEGFRLGETYGYQRALTDVSNGLKDLR